MQTSFQVDQKALKLKDCKEVESSGSNASQDFPSPKPSQNTRTSLRLLPDLAATQHTFTQPQDAAHYS